MELFTHKKRKYVNIFQNHEDNNLNLALKNTIQDNFL